MSPSAPTYLAHAFGARYDLPIPLLLFVLGGAAIVLVSFALVERRDVVSSGGGGYPDAAYLPLPAGRGEGVATAVGGLATVFFAFLVWAGLNGSQEVPENILPTWFWLIVWIAIPLSCGVLGNWTQMVNPVAFLARLADRPGLRQILFGSAEPVAWPRWLDWWPAVVVFFLTACGELIFNHTMTVPRNAALALAGYAAASIFASLVFGPAWLARGEMFTVLFATWGRLGFLRFGAPGRRGFAGGLRGVPFEASGSRIAFVLLLLISVNFDGLLATPRWSRLESDLGYSVRPDQLEAFRTVSFLVLALTVAAVFGAFALAAGRAGGQATGFRDALAGLLPSMLPIAFGYLLAHNLQYVLINSQLLAPLIGNPTGQQSWPIHLPFPFNDDYEPHVAFLPSSFYWYISVAVIIAVHVAAVVIAHRHLGERGVSRSAARRSEYPWLIAMVAYTMLSLWLIAQPLVKEGGPSPKTAATAPSTIGSQTTGAGLQTWPEA